MKRFHEYIPDAQTLLDLEAPELAGVVLEFLSALPPKDPAPLHLRNFAGLCTGSSRDSPYPEQHWKAINVRIAEAWAWLIAQGLIAPHPETGSNGWVFVTRLGRKVASAAGVVEYRKALELPKDKLHQAIAARCFGHFIRGLYDTAVFEAYKALEVSIRDASGIPGLLGVPLARKAFAQNDGPLTDKSADPGERQALCDLMAGAIGSYKNPHSHRNVSVSPEEAVEMVILASHLLRIVDSRKPKQKN